jgi:hypothetical protein
VQNPRDGRCYNCGERGHFASACPKPHNRPNQTLATNAVPNRYGNPTSVAARQNFVHDRINHVIVDEAQEAPDVVLGMFSVNSTTAIVLFDSGVSHSFISATYVERHNIPVAMLRCHMLVSSPRGDMPARQVCLKVEIILRGVGFNANLIILDSKGMVVILGMDWMSKQNALINYAKKAVKLTTKDGRHRVYSRTAHHTQGCNQSNQAESARS